MINIYKKEQLEELKEAEEIITLLDENYRANRGVDKDLGGYIALLELKEFIGYSNKVNRNS